MKDYLEIEGRRVGPGEPAFIIAEMSANHDHDFEKAVEIMRAAKDCGADAVKLQTYTAETMTIDSDKEYFRIGKGTIWEGKSLYRLYEEAYTPWEWHPKLKKVAEDLGMVFFSTPFDATSVDFLESMEVSLYKVASFEMTDLPLVELVARTGKPLIMSTGMATIGEIDESVRTIERAGADQLALLKCTSAYPASADEVNLRTIPNMRETFALPVGLSDHTLGTAVPVASIAFGACIIEKHFTLSRSEPGPDSAFSLEPDEFRLMVDSVRFAEKALGRPRYGAGEREGKSLTFRRSIFVVNDIEEGEKLTPENVRVIRPGHGLAPKYFNEVLGRRARQRLERGTPVTWDALC